VPLGKLGIWFNYAVTSGSGLTATGANVTTTDGVAFGVAHQRTEWLGGYNWFSIQYGRGAASNFSTAIDDPTPFQSDSQRFRIAEHALLQPNDTFAIMPVIVYQQTKSGAPGVGWNHWLSLAARPQVFFSEHVSAALEAGFDHTESGDGRVEGWLRKITFAPQIGSGRKFFDRPVLRAFVTYASWSNGFRGLVGGAPFAGDTDGLTYGVQAESWW